MAEENFLLVSLKEEEAKKLAQVISNDTSRRILDHLAKVKDDTETTISKKLGLPLSTVHYNLKALLKARLIQANEFHYSEKGKEVNHYSLANKYVIIAPKTAPETLKDKLRKILPVAIITVVCAGFIQFVSMFFRKTANVATWGADMARNTAQEAAPMLAEKVVDSAEEAVASGAIEQEIVPRVAEASQNIFITHPTLLFLYGAVFAIIVFIIMDYIHSRKK